MNARFIAAATKEFSNLESIKSIYPSILPFDFSKGVSVLYIYYFKMQQLQYIDSS